MKISYDSSIENVENKDKLNKNSRKQKDDTPKTEEIIDTTIQSIKKYDSNEDETPIPLYENKKENDKESLIFNLTKHKKHHSTYTEEELKKQQIIKKKIKNNIIYLAASETKEISQEDFEKLKNSVTTEMEIKKLYKIMCGIKYDFTDSDNNNISPLISFNNFPQKITKNLQNFNTKNEELKKYIKNYRMIKKDGNTFYRSIMYRYIEILILTRKIEKFQILINEINNCFSSNEIKSRIQIKDNLYLKPKLIIKVLMIIFSLLVEGDIKQAHIVFNKNININENFDFGIILYFRFTLYTYIKNNQNKLYSESFPIQIGNLLPSIYENNEGNFDFKKFYTNQLLKLFVEAEKICIYITPFVLKINLDIINYNSNKNDIVSHFNYGSLEEDDTITLLNIKKDYYIIYNFFDNEEYKDVFNMYKTKSQNKIAKINKNNSNKKLEKKIINNNKLNKYKTIELSQAILNSKKYAKNCDNIQKYIDDISENDNKDKENTESSIIEIESESEYCSENSDHKENNIKKNYKTINTDINNKAIRKNNAKKCPIKKRDEPNFNVSPICPIKKSKNKLFLRNSNIPFKIHKKCNSNFINENKNISLKTEIIPDIKNLNTKKNIKKSHINQNANLCKSENKFDLMDIDFSNINFENEIVQKKSNNFISNNLVENISFEDENTLIENNNDISEDTKSYLVEYTQDLIDLNILENNINSNKKLINNFDKKCKICQKKCKILKNNEFLLCDKCLGLELYEQIKNIYLEFIDNYNEKESLMKKYKNIFEFLKVNTIIIRDKKTNIDTVLNQLINNNIKYKNEKIKFLESIIIKIKKSYCLKCKIKLRKDSQNYSIPCGCSFCSINHLYFYFYENNKIKKNENFKCSCLTTYNSGQLYELGNIFGKKDIWKLRNYVIENLNYLLKKGCAKCGRKMKKLNKIICENENNEIVENTNNDSEFMVVELIVDLVHYLCDGCMKNSKKGSVFLCWICDKKHMISDVEE